jgi:hypothetical protein
MASFKHTFTSGQTVTPARLNDARDVFDIVNADISATAAIAATKLASDSITNTQIKSDAAIAGSKLADGGVGPAKLSQPLTFETAKATTSGTSVNFTSIPSWVKRITVMLNQVSTDGTSGLIIQLGEAGGGFKTSGYAGTGTAITGTNTCGVSSFTVGFSAGTGTLASSSRSGCLFLLNVGTNTWLASGALTNGALAAGTTAGVVVLDGTLDRVRLTTIGGGDTFDNGSINIAYE